MMSAAQRISDVFSKGVVPIRKGAGAFERRSSTAEGQVGRMGGEWGLDFWRKLTVAILLREHCRARIIPPNFGTILPKGARGVGGTEVRTHIRYGLAAVPIISHACL